MNTTAIRKITILKKLSRIPDSSLNEVITYLDTLLLKNYAPTQDNRSLKGIWKDAGFEKIVDLESELRSVRKELSASILKKAV